MSWMTRDHYLNFYISFVRDIQCNAVMTDDEKDELRNHLEASTRDILECCNRVVPRSEVLRSIKKMKPKRSLFRFAKRNARRWRETN